MTLTISQALNLEETDIDNICPIFDNPENKVNLKDPDTWTYHVTNFGIDEVELLHKKYTLWHVLRKGDNIGRFEGTNSGQVLKIKEDIQQNGVDPTQPPIVVDVDDDDVITGEHRGETSQELGILGWMVQYIKIHCKDPVKRAWIKKRLAKALNNTRIFNQLNNSPDDIREHIKYGITHGQLVSQSQIEDEINFQSNNSLTQAQQKNIISEMVSYITHTGANVKLDRYRTYTDTTYAEYVEKSEDPYVQQVINDPDSHNYWVNMTSGSSIRNTISAAAKVKSDDKKPWLNVQSSVGLPSNKQSLQEKRDNVYVHFLPALSKEIKALFSYFVVHQCLPWEHPECRHAHPAQDHMNEDYESGAFIRR